MSGFSSITGLECIVSADNASFDGTTRAGAMTTDGELWIGSTAGRHVRKGTLTSTDGSVTIIPGSGTIDLSSSPVNVPQDQIYYVGKHGNDANSGLNIEQAKLTFGSAITDASALTPSAVNRYAIVCLDDGIYAESITTVSFVDIFAPNAQLDGNILAVDNVHCRFRQHNVATTFIGVFKTAGTGTFWYEVEEMTMTGTAIGVLCTSGVVQSKWKTMTVENGFGIGDLTSVSAHMHVYGGDIYITGTGTGIARANAGTTVGHVDHILNQGAGAGTAIYNISGETDVTVDIISTTDALRIDAGTLNVHAGSIIGSNDAYNVAGGILSLFYNTLSGALTTTGGVIEKWHPPVDEIVPIANGGTNANAMTNTDGVVYYDGTRLVTTTVGNVNQVLTSNGAAVAPTFQNASFNGIIWSEETGSPLNSVLGHGYICNMNSLLTVNLPSVAAVGDTVTCVGKGSGLFSVVAAAGDTIHFGDQDTSAGGSLTATNRYDTIQLICITADSDWSVTGMTQGNFTVA